jgi:hypothetical protein
MLHKIVLTVAVLLAATVSYAQMPCSTDDHYHQLLQQYPQLAEYEKQFNDQMNQKVAKRTMAVADTTTYDVPLVVHVIHDYGAENIADDAIYDAAAHWAQVYMKQNADTALVISPFIPYIGNPNIRLHLATIDPNGKPTKGIVRTQSYLTNKADDQAKYNAWPNNKYINIWLIGTFGASSSGAAAYAYYPSSGAYMPYYDGVISLYNYINVQKTIPHELGHVLNLEHTWGSTNNPAVACGDDGVDDTPPTMGHMPGCSAAALYDVTCATGYSVTYTTSRGTHDSVVHYPDTVNSQNIMDYTYCELMFTKGQVQRMRTALTATTAGRSNLITPSNLAATGALEPMPDLPPVADYIVNQATGAGAITDTRSYFLTFNNAGSFVFRNASWNDTVSDVHWTFSNGASTPTSTSMGIITNHFSQPGWVTVSLVANSNAGSDTLTNTHAVYAADTAVAGGPGYSQQFANAPDISNWPMFNYYNNQFKWDLYSGAGLGDNSCLRYRSFDTSGRIFGTPVGDYDDIFTPAFNLAGITDSLYLNFFTSGALTTSGLGGWTTAVNDSLQIEASISGGARWTRLAVVGGTDLANNGNHSAEFVPASTSQWKPRAVSIPATFRTKNTFFRFRYFPGNTGNNLYLDNFYFYGFPAGVKEVLNSPDPVNIFPNPATNGCNLVFKTGSDGMVTYTIRDLAGKTVYQAQKTFAPNSIQQEAISRSLTPAAGMYFVTVTIEGVSMVQKLVVY